MDYVEIPLTQGKKALVDLSDYHLVKTRKWFAQKSPRGLWYARCSGNKTVGRISLSMHELIMGQKFIDHRDGNGLNNRRGNLRKASGSQNLANARRQVNNTSGFRGVSFHKSTGKWAANIRVNQRLIYLGLYMERLSAAKAYNDAAHKYFGEFANPNPVGGSNDKS